MPWVKFHAELCEGAKRGLPRAVRFIFMELSIKARTGRGSLELPVGMSDLDALQDVLGGDRREVKEALRALTAGPDPMVVLDGEERARTLVIPSWGRWNAGATEAPGASTERSRRHRAAVAGHGNGEATGRQRPLHDDATVEQRAGNDRPSGEKRREEEIRGEDPPNPPAGGGASKAPRKRAKGHVEDPDVLACWSAWLAGWRQHVGRGVEPVLDAKRAARIAAAIARHGLEVARAAVAGIWRSSWHRENGHTGPEVAWRDAGTVERFAVEREAPPRVQGGAADLAAYQREAAARADAPPADLADVPQEDLPW